MPTGGRDALNRSAFCMHTKTIVLTQLIPYTANKLSRFCPFRPWTALAIFIERSRDLAYESSYVSGPYTLNIGDLRFKDTLTYLTHLK